MARMASHRVVRYHPEYLGTGDTPISRGALLPRFPSRGLMGSRYGEGLAVRYWLPEAWMAQQPCQLLTVPKMEILEICIHAATARMDPGGRGKAGARGNTQLHQGMLRYGHPSPRIRREAPRKPVFLREQLVTREMQPSGLLPYSTTRSPWSCSPGPWPWVHGIGLFPRSAICCRPRGLGVLRHHRCATTRLLLPTCRRLLPNLHASDGQGCLPNHATTNSRTSAVH